MVELPSAGPSNKRWKVENISIVMVPVTAAAATTGAHKATYWLFLEQPVFSLED